MTIDKKIDPEFKAKWVKALRSGRYKQAHKALRRPILLDTGESKIGYCCLGVACDLIDPSIWEPSKNPEGTNDSFDWGGVPSFSTRAFPFVTPPVSAQLAQMNDEGKTFSEIADWIEANL